MILPDWRGQTIVCIASGPSLTLEDCAAVRESGHPTIITNTTFRDCSWADALYAFDPQWWTWYYEEVKATFLGRLFCSAERRGVECAGRSPAFNSFGNSGADAIALAVAAGSRKIIMLGYDCARTGGKSHHHGDHPRQLRNCNTMPSWSAQFGRLLVWASGARILNASRASALTCFERVTLSEVLHDVR